MRLRRLSALVLLPIVAGCADLPRAFVTHDQEGYSVTVWRFEGEEVVGGTRYQWERPNTEHPTRSVIRAESATVEPPPR